MKTMNRILISLAIGLLFFNNFAIANNSNPTVKVEGSKLYLSLENVSEQTTVRVLDTKGFIWMEERITVAGQFKKVFDLEKLPIGAYNLIIKSNIQEIVQPLTISSGELIMDESKRVAYFQANWVQKRSKLNLSLLNPTNSEVRIIVINMQGIKVFQESIKDQQVINANYNLKQLPKGNYTLAVDNGHEVFMKLIKF